jgi:predicted HTH domain antitoxin
MATKTITVDLPEDLVAFYESQEELEGKVRESLVLSLLRDARISQGRAAILLGVTLPEIMHLKARHCIPSGPETAEEAEMDVEAAWRGVSSAIDARS